ncbi:hypothetical protein KDN34_11115 [Shewanella yunxiaonensis]|uniref:Lipoprotein n=1 Tax=Shewanella yunxiaonensis TaxID=2829809 RepID=A0ABX7YQA7_9GAMM|nr:MULTISPECIES: hypothetical protein [Shewanella]MDF0534803.1 hypothetical protein [Shewanella sp. A32]QUN04799.1 hypothetical protein KDN34_11115 [Shewanella yunxiaonensis]
MKYHNLLLISAALTFGGCGGSDDNTATTPTTPTTPEPSYVSVNDATSLNINVESIDAATKAVTFSLSTDSAEPVTDAGANYVVMYLNIPGEQVSAFAFPWHKAVRFECNASVDACSGTITALETPGEYIFTPGSLEKLGDTIGQLKLAINISGTLAQVQTQLLDIPSS